MLTDARALIAAIAADPRDDLAWIAYADWLIERGDPRGEHIHLERQGQPAKPDDELYLSPELLPFRHYWRLHFERTFIRHARYFAAPDDQAPPEAVRALVADPHAVLLETLRMGCQPELVAELLAAPPPPRLDMLVTVDLRNVQFATYGPGPRGAVAIPTLRELWTCAAALPAVLAGDFDLPAIETLRWFDTQPLPELFGAGSIFARPPPRLSTVMFWGDATRFVAGLVDSPLAGQLRQLDIANLSDADRDVLRAHREAFPLLENAAGLFGPSPS